MLPKAARIVKALVLILLIIAANLFIIYAFIREIPIQQTPINVSFNAVKLDDIGNEIKTVPITISGSLNKHLFQDEHILDVNISDFDGYTNFQKHTLNDISGGALDFTNEIFYSIYFASGSDGLEYFSIYFNEDFSRWAFVVTQYTEENPFYISARYVASTDSNDTVMDLKEFFDGLLIIDEPILKTDPALDWQMHGTFVRTDGTQQAMDLTIAGKIWDYRTKEFHKLDLQIAFPDSFTYKIQTPSDGFTNTMYDNQNAPDLYICSARSVNKDKPLPSKPVSSHFAIDVEKEYFIVIFKDAPACYFVASTDNTPSEEILLHFQDFTQAYESFFWQD